MADIKRLNYFTGQFLQQNDFNDEQSYHVGLQRDHERLLHTPGIAEGLLVTVSVTTPTGVTIAQGIAYDGAGRRLVLGANVEQNLIGVTQNTMYVAMSYREVQSDPETEAGATGNSRWTEAPLIEVLTSPPVDATMKLVLAVVTRNPGTGALSVDGSTRMRAGQKAADLNAYGITIGADGILPSNWVRMDLLSPGGIIEVHGGVKVDGNIGVGAGNTVDGRDVSTDGSTLDTHVSFNVGNPGNPHGTTAAQVNALPIGGGTLAGNIITDDSTRRFRDGKVRAAATATNSITTQNTTNTANWANIGLMTHPTIVIAGPAATGSTQIPVLVRFSMGGVTISKLTGIADGFAEFQLIVDGNTTTPACFQSEFLIASASGNFEIRSVTMERLLFMAAGTHSFQMRWSIRSAQATASIPVTLNGCYIPSTSRELAVIEL
ncbi:MAG TPA: hypothetical protein VIV60_18255 [Polyangiaceae bacterium]